MTFLKNEIKLALMVLFFSFLFLWNINYADASTTISAPIDTDTTWTLENSPYVIYSYDILRGFTHVPLVSSGVTLTIEPGVIVKIFGKYGISINGNLRVNGTSEQKVYFTSYNDDTIGGDTNNDGLDTAPQVGDWANILFHQGSTGVFNNTVIRYGGSYYYSYYAETVGSISNHGGNISVTDSLVENNVLYGVKTYAGTTNISGTVLRDYWGFYGGGGQNKIEDLITLTNNVFDGGIYINLNGVRNFLHSGNTSTKSDGIYISGKLSQNQTWTKDNMPYIINGSGTTNYNSSDYVFSVPLGVTLNIDPGVIVKFKRNMSVSVKGNLIINGTNEQKVYFTSINDDTVGGDTNNDQSDIAPSAGDWNHLFFGDK